MLTNEPDETQDAEERREPEQPAVKPSIADAIKQTRLKLERGEASPAMKDPAIIDAATGVVTPGAGEPEAVETAAAPAAEVTDGVTEPAEASTEGTGEPAAAEEPSDADKALVVIPAFREGQEAIEIEMSDPDTAERVRAAVRGGLRRDQFHRAMQDVEQRDEELRQLEDEIGVDPVNFIFERIQNRDHRVALARQLVADPAVFEALKDELANWSGDDRERRAASSTLETDRLRKRDDWREEVDARGAARRAARDIRAAVDRMIPETMEDETAAMLKDDLLRDARDIQAQTRRALRPADLPGILARRLKQYGVDPAVAARAITADDLPPIRSASARRPAAPAARRPDEAAARSTGQQFVKAGEAKRRAAAVPGVGAGSPAAGPRFPQGQSVKQRIGTLRKLLGR